MHIKKDFELLMINTNLKETFKDSFFFFLYQKSFY